MHLTDMELLQLLQKGGVHCDACGHAHHCDVEEVLLGSGVASRTAEVLARWGKLPEGGLGLISLSGGLCEIAADRAADAGVKLPSLSSATTARLAAALPNFGTPHNPLDVTGGALLDPSMLEKSLDAMTAESEFAAVVAVLDVASAAADDSKLLRQLLAGVAKTGICGRRLEVMCAGGATTTDRLPAWK